MAGILAGKAIQGGTVTEAKLSTEVVGKINNGGGTLTETDPLFTAWKDGTSVSVGAYAATSPEPNAYALAMGTGSQALGFAGIAVGYSAISTQESHAVSVGSYSSAQGAYSTAVGPQSAATGESSMALGYLASTSADDSVSLGASSAVLSADLDARDTKGVVSVGSAGSFTRRIMNVSEGIQGTDAATVSQVEALRSEITGGSGSKVYTIPALHGLEMSGLQPGTHQFTISEEARVVLNKIYASYKAGESFLINTVLSDDENELSDEVIIIHQDSYNFLGVDGLQLLNIAFDFKAAYFTSLGVDVDYNIQLTYSFEDGAVYDNVTMVVATNSENSVRIITVEQAFPGAVTNSILTEQLNSIMKDALSGITPRIIYGDIKEGMAVQTVRNILGGTSADEFIIIYGRPTLTTGEQTGTLGPHAIDFLLYEEWFFLEFNGKMERAPIYESGYIW